MHVVQSPSICRVTADLFGSIEIRPFFGITEWAAAVVQGRCDGEPSYRYSAGMIALRPDCDGRIAGYEGIDPEIAYAKLASMAEGAAIASERLW